MKYMDKSYENSQEIVDIFSQFFSSVFAKPHDNINFNNNSDKNLFENINITHITLAEIEEAIKKLKNKFTSGPDLIPSFVVKDCAYVLSVPLYIIFNLSLKTSTFPKDWKIAKACPIFKAGDPANVNNYRQISILSNFAKVFEMILYNHIYLSTKTMISPYQHGFMANRSTITNLVLFTQNVSNIIDDQGQVDALYTDFSKAFDRIDHKILLNKLEHFGFNNQLLMFFESYLQNRYQFVFYNGSRSSVYSSTSGVPQGSNLGPLLFLLFINDLCETLECDKLIYADDLKLFKNIKSEDDCRKLQKELDKISQWCSLNRLDLNVGKCKVVSYTKKKNKFHYNYSIMGTILERDTLIKDLGIYFDPELNFGEHIRIKCNEAIRLLGFILRNCKSFTNLEALKLLYYSYVRSKLEYGAIIWNPHYQIHKTSVEQIQRKFLKFMTFKSTGQYPERGVNNSTLLSTFNFKSLEFRRICYFLVFLFKLMHNKIDSPEMLVQLNIHVPRLHSRQNNMFYSERANTNVMLKSPIYCMCNYYNKINELCDLNVCSQKELIKCAKQVFNI